MREELCESDTGIGTRMT